MMIRVMKFLSVFATRRNCRSIDEPTGRVPWLCLGRHQLRGLFLSNKTCLENLQKAGVEPVHIIIHLVLTTISPGRTSDLALRTTTTVICRPLNRCRKSGKYVVADNYRPRVKIELNLNNWKGPDHAALLVKLCPRVTEVQISLLLSQSKPQIGILLSCVLSV